MPNRKRPLVVVTRKLPDIVETRMRELFDARLNLDDKPMSHAELAEAARAADVLVPTITDRIDAAVLSQSGEKLKLIANFGNGVDNIDVATALQRGITVTNTPGVLTEATADLTLALLLAVARRIPEADRFTRAGRFTGWQPLLLLGAELPGKTLGIVGMGRIGRAVARRALGFGMSILYTNRQPLSPEAEHALSASFTPLEAVLRQADFLSLHVPYTPQTHHLLNAETLALMKPEAYLINTARGAIVDEAALVAALQTGRLRGAALDVFEDEPRIHPTLLQMDQAVLAPHIGSATRETRARMATTAAGNILAHLRGETPPNLVP